MEQERIDRAMTRIETALARIEAAAGGTLPGGPARAPRDEALRGKVGDALARLDALIARIEP